ncbi:MAG: hypothetical protein ACTHMR_02335, partial [Thermomicrobiales bacterium]
APAAGVPLPAGVVAFVALAVVAAALAVAALLLALLDAALLVAALLVAALLVADEVLAAAPAVLVDVEVVPTVGVAVAPPQAVTTTPATARPVRLSSLRRVSTMGTRGSSMIPFSSLTTSDP